MITALCSGLAIGLQFITTGPKLIATSVVIGLALFVSLVALSRQPTALQNISFTVPLVPWLPAIAIFFNVYQVGFSSALGQKNSECFCPVADLRRSRLTDMKWLIHVDISVCTL